MSSIRSLFDKNKAMIVVVTPPIHLPHSVPTLMEMAAGQTSITAVSGELFVVVETLHVSQNHLATTEKGKRQIKMPNDQHVGVSPKGQ